MERRDFIRLAGLGTATGIIAPAAVLAEECDNSADMAGGVYYTREHPGRWGAQVADHHVPIIEVSGKDIKITTPHGMTGYQHYINKHIVLNDKYEFIAEKHFDPMKDKAPVSEFSLGDYSGRIVVLSVCNLHDTWLNLAVIA